LSNLKTMYPGAVNSPETFLTAAITPQDTVITVATSAVFADVPLPFLMVIGGNVQNAETVLVESVEGNNLSVERGYQGVPQSWGVATSVSINFTEAHYSALVDNITTLNKATVQTVPQTLTEPQQAQARQNINAMPDYTSLLLSPDMHRNIYRGKFLGTSVTDEQLQAIRSGTFDDLFIGDYWTIGGFDWLIADINYWLHSGDLGVGLVNNHLVIVPRQPLYTERMNPTATTAGGYGSSNMRATGLIQAVNIISSAFPNIVLTRRECFVTETTSGLGSAIAWLDSIVDLMGEVEVFGSIQNRPTGNGSVRNLEGVTVSRSQFSLFRLKPEAQIVTDPIRTSYWLRNVVTTAMFARVLHNGNAGEHNAQNNNGVRPSFAIG